MNASIDIEKMIVIDDTGMPRAPGVRQLMDKDVLELWSRDKSKEKTKYLQEAGVIYYLGDPKSPAKQQGLSDDEALQMAIDNFNLPKDYVPDLLVKRLIDKYYISNITEAGVALEALQKSVHLVSIAANKLTEYLNKKLINSINDEEVANIISVMQTVSKQVQEIPSLTKAIGVARENLRNEEEEQLARGGKRILSSMNADEEIL
jgi:hypothetical protein